MEWNNTNSTKEIGIVGDIASANLCFRQWLLDEAADPKALEAAIIGFKQILAKLEQPDYLLPALHKRERHILFLEIKKYRAKFKFEFEKEDTLEYAVQAEPKQDKTCLNNDGA